MTTQKLAAEELFYNDSFKENSKGSGSGYQVNYQNSNPKMSDFLDPQFLSSKVSNPFTQNLYDTGALSYPKSSSCHINILFVAQDKMGPSPRVLLKTQINNYKVQALASRADIVQVLHFNTCSQPNQIHIFNLYRGNRISTELCPIPENFKVSVGMKPKSIILANYYLLAGRNKFIECVKATLSLKLRQSKLGELPEFPDPDNFEIHALVELNRFRAPVKLAIDVSLVFAKSLSFLLAEKTKPLREMLFDKINSKLSPESMEADVVNLESIAEHARDRSKFSGSGYSRALLVSQIQERILPWVNYFHQFNGPGSLEKFESAFTKNVGSSLSYSRLMKLLKIDTEKDVLRNSLYGGLRPKSFLFNYKQDGSFVVHDSGKYINYGADNIFETLEYIDPKIPELGDY